MNLVYKDNIKDKKDQQTGISLRDIDIFSTEFCVSWDKSTVIVFHYTKKKRECLKIKECNYLADKEKHEIEMGGGQKLRENWKWNKTKIRTQTRK